MQLSGLLHGSKLLRFVNFAVPEVLGPDASEAEIKALLDRHRMVFIKPIFKGAVGKKGKAGLVGKAKDSRPPWPSGSASTSPSTATATSPRSRRVSPSRRRCRRIMRSTSRSAISTRYRAPTITITHHGGVDIEELGKDQIAEVPFEALTGLKAFVIANALADIKAPDPIISPLVQQLPRLWELVHDFGMTTLELNPIRMRPGARGRLTPVACDFKCGFDRDDARWERLGLPPDLFAADQSEFETEINQLRTHQGQSDVYVINPNGTILAPTFGGGANSLVSEVLGDDAIISSDFGGNPPYEKMKEVARICFKHWLKQSNVLFIIGGKSNNTDIFTTFRAMGDALREHFSAHGPTPLYVVVGRGGPKLIAGMGALQDTVEALGLPYRFFGFDSAISEVVNYAQAADRWMKAGGRAQVAQRLGLRKAA